MKTFFILLVSGLALCAQSTNKIGRFRLFVVPGNSAVHESPTLWKLDTVTGDTWRYSEQSLMNTNGVKWAIDGWVSVGDYTASYHDLPLGWNSATQRGNTIIMPKRPSAEQFLNEKDNNANTNTTTRPDAGTARK